MGVIVTLMKRIALSCTCSGYEAMTLLLRGVNAFVREWVRSVPANLAHILWGGLEGVQSLEIR